MFVFKIRYENDTILTFVVFYKTNYELKIIKVYFILFICVCHVGCFIVF